MMRRGILDGVGGAINSLGGSPAGRCWFRIMPFLIDKAAREIALTQWALPDCLHVPIAAVDEVAIIAYIGGGKLRHYGL